MPMKRPNRIHPRLALHWKALTTSLALTGMLSSSPASAGLPFTEDFSSTSFMDTTLTSADWSSADQQVRISQRTGRAQSLPDNTNTGADIGSNTGDTYWLVYGDVDKDGDLDLISGNYGETNNLFLNDGTGSFSDNGTAINSATDSTYWLVLGDVDGDGDLDLIDGHEAGISLFRNDGSGNFDSTATQIGPATDTVSGLELADVDNDGDLDLLTAEFGATNKVFFNDGSGGFDSTGTAVGSESDDTYGIHLADVDGDGDVDLLAANDGATNKAYFNNGSGGFSSAGTAIGSETNSSVGIASADLDGDGDLDLIVGNQAQSSKVYFNNGSGAFSSTGTSIDTSPEYTTSIDLGDVDGDGDPDLVLGNTVELPISDGSANTLYLNTGGGVFSNTGMAIGSEVDQTYSVRLADFDRDGDLDLATGNSMRSNKLYLNNGADSFGSGEDLGVGDTSATQLADVDNDGDLDLLLGIRNAANSLLLNDGSGNFGSPTDISSVSGDTRALAFFDLNGDSHLDVITGNDGKINQYHSGDGSGSFSDSGTGIGAETDDTLGIAVADVDGDGDLDVISGNYGQFNRLHLNDGSGHFPDNGTAIGPAGSSTNAVVLTDINGDSFPDLIVANEYHDNRLFLNDGSGNFPDNGTVLGDTIRDSDAIATGDVNGDGYPDIVFGNTSLIGSGVNELFINDASGGFPAASTALGSEDEHTYALALFDMDNDGDLDLVTGAPNSTSNKLYLNDGSGTFSATGIDIGSTDYHTRSVSVGDVDGDGDADLVVGNVSLGNSELFRNLRNINGIDARVEGIGSEMDETFDIALGDLDNDGDLDLVAANRNATINRFYLNDGSANFSSTGGELSTDADDTYAVALGDLDGDGDLDVIAGNDGGLNKLYLNGGSASFPSGSSIGSESDRTFDVALADVDKDGDLDLLTANYESTRNRLYLNDGSAGFSSTGVDIGSESESSLSLVLGDLDGDGDLDLIVGNDGVTNKAYFNDGSGGFSSTGTAIGSETNTTTALDLADVDGDGDLDLVTGEFGATSLLYLNDGSGGFSSTGTPIGSETDATQSVQLADINGDGSPDLLVGNSGIFNPEVNRLYLNDGTGNFSATGRAFSPVENATQALLTADLDGDGGLDMVAGNGNLSGEANQLFRSVGYLPHQGRVVSTRVNGTDTNINGLLLTVTDEQNTDTSRNTAIDYSLSNDGGTTWHGVTPGIEFFFPASGDDVRWKAELRSSSPSLTPTLSQLALAIALDSDSDGVGDNADNCPNTSNADQINSDSDAYGDACDEFPNDSTEWVDSDFDGVGDNADKFPSDPDRADDQTQTITFDALADKTIGDADFDISATASSNLSVSFTSETTATCTISGHTVTLVAEGACTIKASQPGNLYYQAAADQSQTFTIHPQHGLIVFLSSASTTSEAGASASIQFYLNREPQEPVTITLTSSDITEGTPDNATASFDSGNWGQAAIVHISGVDDSIYDGDIAYTITLTASSGDSGFNGVSSMVSLTNLDNEEPTGANQCHQGNHTIADTSVTENATVQAEGTLNTSGDVVVGNGVEAYFEAGTSITLNAGFSALSGSNFTARIKVITCSEG